MFQIFGGLFSESLCVHTIFFDSWVGDAFLGESVPRYHVFFREECTAPMPAEIQLKTAGVLVYISYPATTG